LSVSAFPLEIAVNLVVVALAHQFDKDGLLVVRIDDPELAAVYPTFRFVAL
jgi:hypothetical protein